MAGRFTMKKKPNKVRCRSYKKCNDEGCRHYQPHLPKEGTIVRGHWDVPIRCTQWSSCRSESYFCVNVRCEKVRKR